MSNTRSVAAGYATDVILRKPYKLFSLRIRKMKQDYAVTS